MAETPPSGKDPVVTESLSFPLLIAALLLVAMLSWALFDETYWQRPWKGFQSDFVALFKNHLQTKAIPGQSEQEAAIRASSEYQALEAELQQAEQATAQQVGEIDQKIRLLAAQILVLNRTFAEARGQVSALTYSLEHTEGDSAKASLQEDIQEARSQPREAILPVEGGAVEKRSFFGSVPFRFWFYFQDVKKAFCFEPAGSGKPGSGRRQ